MSFETQYANPGPSRAEIDAIPGAAVLEFGTPWCGWCRAAQPLIADAFATHPQLRHMKVEDAKLRNMLGIASINFKQNDQKLAIIDTPLAG